MSGATDASEMSAAFTTTTGDELGFTSNQGTLFVTVAKAEHKGYREVATSHLTREQVRELRDELTAWLGLGPCEG